MFDLGKACGKTMNYSNLVFPEHEVDDALMHLLKQVGSSIHVDVSMSLFKVHENMKRLNSNSSRFAVLLKLSLYKNI